MSNDAKLGLVLGVALVLVIGLVFFRNDSLDARPTADQTRATPTLKKDEPPRPADQVDLSSAKP